MSPTPEVLALLRNSAERSGKGIAVQSMDTSGDIETWQQVLPAGFFKAADGRPFDVPTGKWFINGNVAGRIISQARARSTDIVIDYEHQTLLSEQNGKPAPAAGWVTDIEWREGSGLWIKPAWTARAKEHIRGKEYRYLSAVFPYETSMGFPQSLHSVALVNLPAIDGMAPVASLRTGNQPQVAASSPVAALSSGERKALDKAYVNTSAYLDKREAFCRSQGTSWAQLTALTPEELQVIRLTGLDKEAFTATKLNLLVEDILRFG